MVPTDVIEIHIEPVRCTLTEMVQKFSPVIVEGVVEPELVGQPGNLVGVTGTAKDPAVLEFGDLSDNAADRTGGALDEYRLAILERTYFE